MRSASAAPVYCEEKYGLLYRAFVLAKMKHQYSARRECHRLTDSLGRLDVGEGNAIINDGVPVDIALMG